MKYKYKNPIGTTAYNTEKQLAYLARRRYKEQLNRWNRVVDNVYDMEVKGYTYSQIAQELADNFPYRLLNKINKKKGE